MMVMHVSTRGLYMKAVGLYDTEQALPYSEQASDIRPWASYSASRIQGTRQTYLRFV